MAYISLQNNKQHKSIGISDNIQIHKITDPLRSNDIFLLANTRPNRRRSLMEVIVRTD